MLLHISPLRQELFKKTQMNSCIYQWEIRCCWFLFGGLCPPQPPLEFWEDHPGSEKQLWLFIKDTLLHLQGIPINHEQKDENNQRACSKRQECPAGSLVALGSSRGVLCLPCPLPQCLSTPWCYGPRAMKSHLHSRHGCTSHIPKPSWIALDPQLSTTIQMSEESLRRIQARTHAPVSWPITFPLPPLCAQPGLCLCWSCTHTWLRCVGVNPTVITDYRNYSSPETWYFFIHLVCALKNQIKNRLASIPSFYKWQRPTATEMDLKPLITQFLCPFVSHICQNPTL